MKKLLVTLLSLTMIFGATACGGTSENDTPVSQIETAVPVEQSETPEQPAPVEEPIASEEPEKTEEPEQTGDLDIWKIIDGYNEWSENNTASAECVVEVGGMRFRYPGYFDVEYTEKEESSEFDYCFYPSVDEYYAGLEFEKIDTTSNLIQVASTKGDLISALKNYITDNGGELLAVEDAPSPAPVCWVLNYEIPGERGGRGAYVLLGACDYKLALVHVFYNYYDASDYDYVGDFYEMLNNVELLEAEGNTEPDSSTTVKDDCSDAKHETKARRAFENYGEYMYPYGIKYHWFSGQTSEYEGDGVWYFKVDVTITNAYNASYDGVASGRVDFKQEKVTEFKVKQY